MFCHGSRRPARGMLALQHMWQMWSKGVAAMRPLMCCHKHTRQCQRRAPCKQLPRCQCTCRQCTHMLDARDAGHNRHKQLGMTWCQHVVLLLNQQTQQHEHFNARPMCCVMCTSSNLYFISAALFCSSPAHMPCAVHALYCVLVDATNDLHGHNT